MSQVIKGKYGKFPIDQARTNKLVGRASWAYRSMCNAATSFKLGLTHIVGDGKSIDIVEDIWLRWGKQFSRIMEWG